MNSLILNVKKDKFRMLIRKKNAINSLDCKFLEGRVICKIKFMGWKEKVELGVELLLVLDVWGGIRVQYP